MPEDPVALPYAYVLTVQEVKRMVKECRDVDW